MMSKYCKYPIPIKIISSLLIITFSLQSAASSYSLSDTYTNGNDKLAPAPFQERHPAGERELMALDSLVAGELARLYRDAPESAINADTIVGFIDKYPLFVPQGSLIEKRGRDVLVKVGDEYALRYSIGPDANGGIAGFEVCSQDMTGPVLRQLLRRSSDKEIRATLEANNLIINAIAQTDPLITRETRDFLSYVKERMRDSNAVQGLVDDMRTVINDRAHVSANLFSRFATAFNKVFLAWRGLQARTRANIRNAREKIRADIDRRETMTARVDASFYSFAEKLSGEEMKDYISNLLIISETQLRDMADGLPHQSSLRPRFGQIADDMNAIHMWVIGRRDVSGKSLRSCEDALRAIALHLVDINPELHDRLVEFCGRLSALTPALDKLPQAEGPQPPAVNGATLRKAPVFKYLYGWSDRFLNRDASEIAVSPVVEWIFILPGLISPEYRTLLIGVSMAGFTLLHLFNIDWSELARAPPGRRADLVFRAIFVPTVVSLLTVNASCGGVGFDGILGANLSSHFILNFIVVIARAFLEYPGNKTGNAPQDASSSEEHPAIAAAEIDDTPDGDTTNKHISRYIDEGRVLEVDALRLRITSVDKKHLYHNETLAEKILKLRYSINGKFRKIKQAQSSELLREIVAENKNFGNLSAAEREALLGVAGSISISLIKNSIIIAEEKGRQSLTHVRTGINKHIHGLEPTVYVGERLFDRLSARDLAQLLLEESQHVVRKPVQEGGVWINLHGRSADASDPSKIVEHDEKFRQRLHAIANKKGFVEELIAPMFNTTNPDMERLSKLMSEMEELRKKLELIAPKKEPKRRSAGGRILKAEPPDINDGISGSVSAGAGMMMRLSDLPDAPVVNPYDSRGTGRVGRDLVCFEDCYRMADLFRADVFSGLQQNIGTAGETKIVPLAKDEPAAYQVREMRGSFSQEKTPESNRTMLLIGIGLGVTAVEIALLFPDINIVGVNKEEGLVNKKMVIDTLKDHYPQQAIEDAMKRVSVVTADVEDKDGLSKALGGRIFDYVIFEPYTTMYLKDGSASIENLFNNYTATGGIFAFEDPKWRFDGSSFSGNRVWQVVNGAINSSSVRIKRYADPPGAGLDSDIAPFRYYQKTIDKPVKIPLKYIKSEASKANLDPAAPAVFYNSYYSAEEPQSSFSRKAGDAPVGRIEWDPDTGKVGHRNTVEQERFITPEGWLTKNPFDAVGALAAAGEKVLGYDPLVSVTGSATYMDLPDGGIDWKGIGDLDLRLFTTGIVTPEVKRSIVDRFVSSTGIACTVSPLSLDGYNLEFIKPGQDKPRVIQIIFGTISDLGSNVYDSSVYKISDAYFGNVNFLNAQLTHMRFGAVLENHVQHYLTVLQRVKKGLIAADPTDAERINTLKMCSQLAALIGQPDTITKATTARREIASGPKGRGPAVYNEAIQRILPAIDKDEESLRAIFRTFVDMVTPGDLTHSIIDRIRESGGKITFEEFQRIAAVEGYYKEGRAEFGESSTDGKKFKTDAGPGAAQAFARNFHSYWEEMGKPDVFNIVEQGPGDGSMALYILDAIRDDERMGDFYKHVQYTIIDLSADWSNKQDQLLRNKHPGVRCIVGSVLNMPFEDNSIEGVFFSNELPDAFPVHRVVMRGGVLKEIYVTFDKGEFKEIEAELSTDRINEYFSKKFVGKLPPEGKEIAVNLHLFKWMEEVNRVLRRGFVVTSDYGFEKTQIRYDSAHEEAVWNLTESPKLPLLTPGIDITHNVDFETLDKIGRSFGLAYEHLGSFQTFLTIFSPGAIAINPEEFILIQSKGMKADAPPAPSGTGLGSQPEPSRNDLAGVQEQLRQVIYGPGRRQSAETNRRIEMLPGVIAELTGSLGRKPNIMEVAEALHAKENTGRGKVMSCYNWIWRNIPDLERFGIQKFSATGKEIGGYFDFAGLELVLPDELSGKVKLKPASGVRKEMRELSLQSADDPGIEITFVDRQDSIEIRFMGKVSTLSRPSGTNNLHIADATAFISFRDAALGIPESFGVARKEALLKWLKKDGVRFKLSSRNERRKGITFNPYLLSLPAYYAQNPQRIVIYRDNYHHSRYVGLVDSRNSGNTVLFEKRDGELYSVESGQKVAADYTRTFGGLYPCNLAKTSDFTKFDEALNKEKTYVISDLNSLQVLGFIQARFTFRALVPLEVTGFQTRRTNLVRNDREKYPSIITRATDGRKITIASYNRGDSEFTLSCLHSISGKPVVLDGTNRDRPYFNLNVLVKLIGLGKFDGLLYADPIMSETFNAEFSPTANGRYNPVLTYKVVEDKDSIRLQLGDPVDPQDLGKVDIMTGKIGEVTAASGRPKLIVRPNGNDEVQKYVARQIVDEVRSNPKTVLGLFTGGTSEGVYREVIRLTKEENVDWSGVTTFNLDEYLNIDPDHPQSYRNFMNRNLFDALANLPETKNRLRMENTNLPDTAAADPEAEMQSYVARIRACGGVKLWSMGIGTDGHYAFLEPAVVMSKDYEKMIGVNRSSFDRRSEFAKKIRDFNEFVIPGEISTDYEKVKDLVTRVLVLQSEARADLSSYDDLVARYIKTAEGSGRAISVSDAKSTIGRLGGRMRALSATSFYLALPKDALDRLRNEIKAIFPNAEIMPEQDYFGRPAKVVSLAIPTIIDNSRFFEDVNSVPLKALTVSGVVRESKRVIQAVTGKGKHDAIMNSLNLPPSPELPSSIFQSHSDYTAVLDEDAATGGQKKAPEAVTTAGNTGTVSSRSYGKPKKMSLDDAFILMGSRCLSSGVSWDDLTWSKSMADEIVKHPDIQKVAVVGSGLKALPVLLALTGREVVFIDANPLIADVMLEDIMSMLPDYRDFVNIRSICGEIGMLDLNEEGLAANSFDLITFVDLVGGITRGRPKEWLVKAREMLRDASGYLIIDEHSGSDSIVAHFDEVFPEHTQLADGRVFKGTYDRGDPMNRLYRIGGRAAVSEPAETNTKTLNTAAVNGIQGQFVSIHNIFASGNESGVKDGTRILLSESLFVKDGDESELTQVRLALASLLNSGHIAIMKPEEIIMIEKRERNKVSKDKLAIVLTADDWKGSPDEGNLKASLLIINDRLTGANYLYLEGVIGLARALMANNKQAVQSYYKLIFGVDIGADLLGLLDGESLNNIAFAVKAILSFKPIDVIDLKDLDDLRIRMENFLIAA